MSKKDYELIATAIWNKTFQLEPFDLKTKNHNRVVYQVAFSIADALELENPRFDRMKFLKVCGVIF